MSSSDLEEDKLSAMKYGRFTIKPGAPIEIQELTERQIPVSEDEMLDYRRIASAIKSYLISSKELIEGKYAHIKSVAPIHTTGACRPIIFMFSDGILVRYDLKDNPELRVLYGVIQDEGTLSEWAPKLTDSFIHCPAEPEGYDPGDQTIKLDLSVGPQEGGYQRSLV